MEDPDVTLITGEIRLRTIMIDANPDKDAARAEWARQLAELAATLAAGLADKARRSVTCPAVILAVGCALPTVHVHIHAAALAVALAARLAGHG